MRSSRSTTTTVAILGADTLVEDSLVRLLREEGYTTRLLEAYPTGVVDELLDGADVLLLAPGLDASVRGAFLDAMSRTPRPQPYQSVLALSPAIKQALLDELGVSVPWRSLFKELVGQIEAALGRAAARTRALPAYGEELA